MFPVQSQPPLHQYRLVTALLGGHREKVSFPVVKSPERFVRVTVSIVCIFPVFCRLAIPSVFREYLV